MQVLFDIAEEARQLIGAESSVVALAENDGEQVYYAAATGKHAERLTNRRAPSATSGLCGVAFQGREPVLVCQTLGDPRVRQDHVQALAIKTALAVPFHQAGRLLGAIMVLNREDGQEFTPQDEQTLKDYADKAASRVADYLNSQPMSSTGS